MLVGLVLCGAVALALADPPTPPEQAELAPDSNRVLVVLTPHREAVLAAEVPGKVAHVDRELGEPFAADDVLVRLVDETYAATEAIAAARLRCATAELEAAQRNTARESRQRHAAAVLKAAEVKLEATQRLHDRGQASQVELESARRDVETARAECELVATAVERELAQAQRELAIAENQLRLATHELAACELTAPYAGRVAEVLVQAYEWVERGAPLLKIVDDRVLRAKFLMPARLFESVTIGDAVNVTINETGSTVAARVAHVAAVLDPASETFEVYADLDNRAGQLRAGMKGLLVLPQLAQR